MAIADVIIRKLDHAHRHIPLFIASIVGLATLLVGAGLVSWRTSSEQQAQSRAYEHALGILQTAGEIEIASLNALRGERGYVLTHNSDYLEPLTSGAADMSRSLDQLARLTNQNHEQAREAQALRNQSGRYLALLHAIVKLEKQGRHAEAIAAIKRGNTRAAITDITARLDTIERTERARLALAAAELKQGTATQMRFLYAMAFAGLCLVVFAALAIAALRRATAREARYRDELRRLANTDELTGLSNRRELLASLNRAIAGARRSSAPLAFAIIDIDHFKHVNDSFGHPAGDEVIRKIARLALAAVRGCDIVGRLGGEEFGIVLPGAGVAAAYSVCERLRARVLSDTIELADGRSISVTISTGVARLNPDDTAESLMERADQALYEAKHGGRDQVRLAA